MPLNGTTYIRDMVKPNVELEVAGLRQPISIHNRLSSRVRLL